MACGGKELRLPTSSRKYTTLTKSPQKRIHQGNPGLARPLAATRGEECGALMVTSHELGFVANSAAAVLVVHYRFHPLSGLALCGPAPTRAPFSGQACLARRLVADRAVNWPALSSHGHDFGATELSGQRGQRFSLLGKLFPLFPRLDRQGLWRRCFKITSMRNGRLFRRV